MLVNSASFAPRLIIELDDRSHDRADRRERDAFVDDVLASAGIPILHIRWQRHYDTSALAVQLADALGVVATVIPVAIPASAPAAAAQNLAFATPMAAEPRRDPVLAAAAPAQPTPMRYACGQCQAELREGAKFCSQCGAVFQV